MGDVENRRILAIDDQEAILQDFRKILGSEEEEGGASLQSARSAFFGGGEAVEEGTIRFELSTAGQGAEGIELVERAVRAGTPFAVAFVDVRMPPGLDGMQTIKGLWAIDPDVQVVICTAYSDYSFEEIVAELGSSDRLLILKKPFDPVEVRQLAGALSEKWNVTRSERLRLEEARQRAEELAETNRALEEANERARAASRAKSEFLANMSHEIRTPMNALLGYVDLLCDPGISSEEQGKYGETIRRSGEHLVAILNDILDISRIEASRVVVNPTDFSPFELAHEVVSLLESEAAEKDVHLELVVPEAIPQVVETDKVRVRQILLNLVGNAIKFTERGFVKLVLHLDEHDQADQRMLYFDVVDSGVGIPEEKLSEIFDSFSQVDTSTTRTAGGTGLGLTISKRLAHILGGEIQVESRVGEGSTFSFWIPVGPQRPASLRTYSKSETESFGEGRRRGSFDPGHFEGRVLLVEDVKFNQALVSAILRKAGAEVVVAENGLVGCEKAWEAERAGTPFDVVLMDMQMPVMDGYDASSRLRDEGYTRPIIALTAHAMKEDREKCLAAGCSEYVTKPLDKHELLDLCRELALDATSPALPADRVPSAAREREA